VLYCRVVVVYVVVMLVLYWIGIADGMEKSAAQIEAENNTCQSLLPNASKNEASITAT
jgi:hypothetical protein